MSWGTYRLRIGVSRTGAWFVVGLLFSLSSALLLLIWRAAVSTPFQDELTFTNLYGALASGRFPPLQELLAAHNGHPYLVLKLLIAATHRLGLPWTWMMYAQVVVLIGCVVLLLPKIQSSDRLTQGAALVGVSLIFLTPRQWENLYWSMQLAFPLFVIASIGAFLSVSRFVGTKRPIWAMGALALALFATATNGAGVFTLLLTTASLLFLWRSRVGLIAVISFAAIGLSLFAAAQALAPRSGIGTGEIAFLPALEHGLKMFAHQVADFPNSRLSAVSVGVLAAALAAYCTLRALRVWPATVFEVLCILLGSLLILGATYSRITVGIFQPDAPRYLSLIAPLSVGCLLLLCRWGNKRLLFIIVACLGVGYLISFRSEWAIGPYRKANLMTAHAQLCNSGSIHAAHNHKFELAPDAIRDIQRLFCREDAAEFLDHATIAGSQSVGYYRETTHTWIGPEFKTRIPRAREIDQILIAGWLPDLASYDQGVFVMRVFADQVLVDTTEIRKPGAFSERFTIPRQATAIRIVSSSRRPLGGDIRDLSWILVAIQFGGGSIPAQK